MEELTEKQKAKNAKRLSELNLLRTHLIQVIEIADKLIAELTKDQVLKPRKKPGLTDEQRIKFRAKRLKNRPHIYR